MVHTGIVGHSTAEDFRVPGVQVGVEVDDGDLAPVGESGAESRKGCGVVASESDYAGSVVGRCVCFSGGDELDEDQQSVG